MNFNYTHYYKPYPGGACCCDRRSGLVDIMLWFLLHVCCEAVCGGLSSPLLLRGTRLRSSFAVAWKSCPWISFLLRFSCKEMGSGCGQRELDPCVLRLSSFGTSMKESDSLSRAALTSYCGACHADPRRNLRGHWGLDSRRRCWKCLPLTRARSPR